MVTSETLSFPYNAFDERGNLLWDTDAPYMVEDGDMATFDKHKFGWLEPPGMSLIEPNLSVMARLKTDIVESFGLTSTIFGETGNMRDVGEPGLARVNLLMEFTVRRYQAMYALFLNDVINVAAEYARVWLNIDLPTEYESIEFVWPPFAPESDGEKADEIAKKVALGLPKAKALEELGYANGEALVAEAAGEEAGSYFIPHSMYDVSNPDPAVEESLDGIIDG